MGGNRKEAGESREVSDQPLGPDFLAEIQSDVAFKNWAPFVGNPVQGGSSRQGGIEVKVAAEFGRGQGMHRLVQRLAGEEVDPCRLEFACA